LEAGGEAWVDGIGDEVVIVHEAAAGIDAVLAEGIERRDIPSWEQAVGAFIAESGEREVRGLGVVGEVELRRVEEVVSGEGPAAHQVEAGWPRADGWLDQLGAGVAMDVEILEVGNTHADGE